jgi:hypothetical protein
MRRDTLRGCCYLLVAALLIAAGMRFAMMAVERSASVQVQLRSAEIKNQHLRDRLAELTARPEAEDHAVAPLISQRSSPAAGRYVVRSSEEGSETAATVRRFDRPVDFFAAHPEFESLYLRTVRSETEANYASFFRLAQLSPDQARRVVDLLTSHAESLADVVAAARGQGLDENDDVVQPLKEQANAELASGLLALLGQAGYDQFQSYQQSLSWRPEVNTLAGMLYASGSPLTFEQANALIAIMVDRLGPPTSVQKLPVLPSTADFNGALAQARAILQPAQLVAFQAELEHINLAVQTAKLQLPKP